MYTIMLFERCVSKMRKENINISRIYNRFVYVDITSQRRMKFLHAK